MIDEPRAVGQVFNIGNGEEITIGDLAEQGQDDDRQHVGDRDGSRTTRRTRRGSRTCRAGCPTSRKIQALIGYAPTVELDEILTRVIEHFRQL